MVSAWASARSADSPRRFRKASPLPPVQLLQQQGGDSLCFLPCGESDDDTPPRTPPKKKRKRGHTALRSAMLMPRVPAGARLPSMLPLAVSPLPLSSDADSGSEDEDELEVSEEEALRLQLARVLFRTRADDLLLQPQRWQVPRPAPPEGLCTPEPVLAEDRRRELAFQEQLRDSAKGQEAVLLMTADSVNTARARQFWAAWWVALAVVKLLGSIRRLPHRRQLLLMRSKRIIPRRPEWVDRRKMAELTRESGGEMLAAVQNSGRLVDRVKRGDAAVKKGLLPPPAVPRDSTAGLRMSAPIDEGPDAEMLAAAEAAALERLRTEMSEARAGWLRNLRMAARWEDEVNKQLAAEQVSPATPPEAVQSPPLREHLLTSVGMVTGVIRKTRRWAAKARLRGRTAGSWINDTPLFSPRHSPALDSASRMGSGDMTVAANEDSSPLRMSAGDAAWQPEVVGGIASHMVGAWRDEPLPPPPVRSDVRYHRSGGSTKVAAPVGLGRRPRGDGGAKARTQFDAFVYALGNERQQFAERAKAELQRVGEDRERTLPRRLKVMLNLDPTEVRLPHCLDHARQAVRFETTANARRERDQANRMWYDRFAGKVRAAPGGTDVRIAVLLQHLGWWFEHGVLTRAAFGRIVGCLEPEVLYSDDVQFVLEHVAPPFGVSRDHFVSLLRERHVHYRLGDAGPKLDEEAADFRRRAQQAEGLVTLQLNFQRRFRSLDKEADAACRRRRTQQRNASPRMRAVAQGVRLSVRSSQSPVIIGRKSPPHAATSPVKREVNSLLATVAAARFRRRSRGGSDAAPPPDAPTKEPTPPKDYIPAIAPRPPPHPPDRGPRSPPRTAGLPERPIVDGGPRAVTAAAQPGFELVCAPPTGPKPAFTRMLSRMSPVAPPPPSKPI